jgi:AcrR family transcriptional regulator
VPKLWNETIDEHRRSVREAILESTWRLVSERGLLAVTMSQIAEATGIGRATLYKYFPDVEAILVAHHQGHVEAHLAELAAIADRGGDASGRLEAVVAHYAVICHHRGRHGTEELSALLHRPEQVADAQNSLVGLFGDLIAEAAAGGSVRADIDPAELASYCLHAPASLPSKASVDRLVTVTMTSLRTAHP